MTAANLQELISQPEKLNRETLYELRNILARYPYFQTARLLYLKNLYLLHDITFGEELRKAALYVADRRVLFYLIEGNKFAIESKQRESDELLSEEPGLDRTLTLIDAFLSTIPEESAQTTNLELSTDYTSYLLQSDELFSVEASEQTDVPKLKGQELIDDFIGKANVENALRLKSALEEPEGEFPPPESILEDSEDDESYFTETLAKIYIKQQRYSKALEIIKKLSLKYPKKNAYFADQIRFLEKLIINAKSK